jgi:hypothetical protein
MPGSAFKTASTAARVAGEATEFWDGCSFMGGTFGENLQKGKQKRTFQKHSKSLEKTCMELQNTL